jgi:hypothetical protein
MQRPGHIWGAELFNGSAVESSVKLQKLLGRAQILADTHEAIFFLIMS